jgi:hypothetical protein
MWGARGPFLLAGAMIVAVVKPDVFCNKATESFYKNTKTSCLKSILYELRCIVKHIIIHVSLIVASTKPELYGGRSPNQFGPMDPGILGITGKLLSL